MRLIRHIVNLGRAVFWNVKQGLPRFLTTIGYIHQRLLSKQSSADTTNESARISYAKVVCTLKTILCTLKTILSQHYKRNPYLMPLSLSIFHLVVVFVCQSSAPCFRHLIVFVFITYPSQVFVIK